MEIVSSLTKPVNNNCSYGVKQNSQNKSSVSFCSDQNNNQAKWLLDYFGYTIINSVANRIGDKIQSLAYENMTTDKFQEISEDRAKNLADEMIKKFDMNSVKRKFCTDEEMQIIFKTSGINAYFLPKKNIAAAPKIMPSLIFHELGHAVIENKTTFLKFLQTHSNLGKRVLPWLWLVMPFIDSIAGQQKAADKDSPFAKITNFIHNHVGSLVFLTFLPQLISEGMASHYGVTFAKIAQKAGKLSEKEVSHIEHRYKWAFITYLTAAGVAALTIKAYEMFRDRLFGYSTKKQNDYSQF